MEGPATYKKYLLQVIRVFYIILFVYAAVTKLLNYSQFETQLSQFPYISSYTSLIAWAVPTLEIFIVFLFFPYKFIKIGLYASFILMLIFTVYIIIVLTFSEIIPCSCGGVIASLSWDEHLVFNIACMLIALMGIILIKKTIKSSKNLKLKFSG